MGVRPGRKYKGICKHSEDALVLHKLQGYALGEKLQLFERSEFCNFSTVFSKNLVIIEALASEKQRKYPYISGRVSLPLDSFPKYESPTLHTY